jgi:hypothetical protein
VFGGFTTAARHSQFGIGEFAVIALRVIVAALHELYPQPAWTIQSLMPPLWRNAHGRTVIPITHR